MAFDSYHLILKTLKHTWCLSIELPTSESVTDILQQSYEKYIRSPVRMFQVIIGKNLILFLILRKQRKSVDFLAILDCLQTSFPVLQLLKIFLCKPYSELPDNSAFLSMIFWAVDWI